MLWLASACTTAAIKPQNTHTLPAIVPCLKDRCNTSESSPMALQERLQSSSLATTSRCAAPLPFLGPACRSSRQPSHCPVRRRTSFTARSADRDVPPPPPMPPPPPPGAQNQGQSSFTQQASERLAWREFKERLRPAYLPATFLFTSLTLGLRISAENFVLSEDPFSYIGCALSTGLLCTAVAWVLFDFTDNPPPGGNFSSPRE